MQLEREYFFSIPLICNQVLQYSKYGSWNPQRYKKRQPIDYQMPKKIILPTRGDIDGSDGKINEPGSLKNKGKGHWTQRKATTATATVTVKIDYRIQTVKKLSLYRRQSFSQKLVTWKLYVSLDIKNIIDCR